jgi:glutamate 5-kinase
MKLVIKLGTAAILADNGTIRQNILTSIVEQIAELQKNGHSVILVSSGAVGSGRRVSRAALGSGYGKFTAEKQVLASLGQHELMQNYSALFKNHDLLTAQVLLTKQDFNTKKHYYNIVQLLQEILTHKIIIPIINENDSVAVEELMFTDNDELAGLIAAQQNADKLIILTSIDGVYDGHPADPASKLIPVINPRDKWHDVSSDKSTQGRGGMRSKLGTARKMSEMGITTHIAHAGEKDVLLRLAKDEAIGTAVLPFRKKSNTKRRIAFNYQENAGTIRINPCLFKIITEEEKALSLLPVGIDDFSGDFKKGDLIDITAPDGKKIGVGIARYGAQKLQEYLGQKSKPVFIHYDQLYIENSKAKE